MLCGVTFVVQGEQAVEDCAPGGLRNGVADALLGPVEAVAEVDVGPAIRAGDGVVHLDVQRAETGHIVRDFVRGVEAIVRGGETLAPGGHDVAAVRVVALADGFEGDERGWEGNSGHFP